MSQPSFSISILMAGIRLYQRTLSPDHGVLRALWPAGVCRFRPTCSEHMLHALEMEGWLGVGRGLRQLLRCHPFSVI